MDEAPKTPLLVFAPFVSSKMRIEPSWLDYNGHLNMAYYLVLLDRGVEEIFALAGLGPTYVDERRASYFAAELHIVYRRELSLSDEVRVTAQVLDHDDKGVHAYFEVRQAQDGWIAAVAEKLFLHVDMATRKVTPFPPDILANVATVAAAHARLPRPTDLGRTVGLRSRRPAPTPEAGDTRGQTRH